MLPRSDKFYVGVIITFSGLVIIASIIAAIAAFSGDSKPNPAYESAPAPSLVQAPPETLLTNSSKMADVLDQISSPPIGDAAFFLIHKTTRKILEAMAAKDFLTKLSSLGLGYEVTREIKSKQSSPAKELGVLSSISAVPGTQQIELSRMKLFNSPSLGLLPGQKKLRIKVNGSQDFVGLIGDSGVDPTNQATLALEMYWEIVLQFDKASKSWKSLGGWHVSPGDTKISTPRFTPANTDSGS